MPQLVITSSGRLLLALVIVTAATIGSTRPMETPAALITMPAIPELILAPDQSERRPGPEFWARRQGD